MQEAVPNLTFGNYKMGRPVQVDIHDPVVAGLIKAGYLKIRWREPRGTDSLDPGGSDSVSAAGVDPGGLGEPAEAQVNGAGEHRSGAEGADSASAGWSSCEADQ